MAWVIIANLKGAPGDAAALGRFTAIEAFQALEPRRGARRIARAEGTPVARNLVPNPGPNAATPAWTSAWGGSPAGGKDFVEDTSAPSGIGYLRMSWVGASTSTAAGARTAEFPATPGTWCAGSIQVRSSKATIAGATLYFYDGAGNQVGSTIFNRLYKITANRWTLLEITGVKVPANTVTMRIGTAGGAGGVLYVSGDTLDFSAAILTAGGIVRPYADGSQENGYWESTPITGVSAFADTRKPFGYPFGPAPGWANRSTGFSLDKHLYIPAGADIGPVRRRIAEALGGTGKYHLAWAGHSIVAGQGGTPGVIDNVKLLAQRALQVGTASPGIVYAQNGTTQDVRVTMSAGWEKAGSPRGNMQAHIRTNVAGETYTHASDTAGTVVEIYTFGNSSPMTYSIDGGAPVTIPPSGSSAGQVTRITGLPNTRHTVVVTSTTTTYAYILGIAVSYFTGLEVSNLGYSGSIAADWAPGGAFYGGYRNITETLKPEGVVIQLGANELIHGTGFASLKTNLLTMISGLQSFGIDVVLVVDPPIEDATKTTWFRDFVPTIYDVADQMGVPLVDYTSKWMTRAIAEVQGFYADQWHPNQAGYLDLHPVMAGALLP